MARVQTQRLTVLCASHGFRSAFDCCEGWRRQALDAPHRLPCPPLPCDPDPDSQRQLVLIAGVVGQGLGLLGGLIKVLLNQGSRARVGNVGMPCDAGRSFRDVASKLWPSCSMSKSVPLVLRPGDCSKGILS